MILKRLARSVCKQFVIPIEITTANFHANDIPIKSAISEKDHLSPFYFKIILSLLNYKLSMFAPRPKQTTRQCGKLFFTCVCSTLDFKVSYLSKTYFFCAVIAARLNVLHICRRF